MTTSVDFGTLAPWEMCSRCSGSATPGARALMAYWLDVSNPVGTSMGIYNCRPVAGTGSLSVHACGRAVDLGVPVVSGGHPAGWAFLERIAGSGRAKALGMQGFIFARTAWYGSSPAGRPYGGVHPHWDHIHAEITAEAGRSLTLATLSATLGVDPLLPAGEDTIMLGLNVGRRGDPVVRDARVGALQAFLVDAGFLPGPGDVDGAAGDATRGALNRWKQAAGITSALSGGEGRIGDWEYARMLAAGSGSGVGVPGPAGPAGPAGPPGPEGPSGTLTIRGSQTIG